MAETASGADIRAWAPETRRTASIWVLVGAIVLLVAGIVFYAFLESQAGWFLIVAIVALALLLLFEAAVIATGVAREEGTGPAWMTGLEPGHHDALAAAEPQPGARRQPGAAAVTQIDLKCPECANVFAVDDDGTRPLHIVCPHCGAEGHVDEGPEDAEHDHARDHDHDHEHGHAHRHEHGAAGTSSVLDEPLEDEPAAGQADAGADNPVLSLKCPACATQFEVEDDGTRPLRALCPGCGRSGRLK